MNITVLNGSPKGEKSVTLQYILYIQKHFSKHKFEFINIGQNINKIEKDEKFFQSIVSSVEKADAVLWITPVFVMLVPSQVKRFIELINERKATKAFKGKYTSVVTSSIHFYDHTANNYMQAVCEDLDMKFTGFYSVDMYDIFIGKNRKQILNYAHNFFDTVENKRPVTKLYSKISGKPAVYKPGKPAKKTSTGGKKIILVTDSENPKSNLGKMITRFKDSYTEEIEEINLHDVDIKGPCISCLRCGYDNTCIYKDGFADFWDGRLAKADIIIMAGTMTDRYLSSKWKLVFDRSFFKNHTPSITKKQIGFLVSGSLNQNENLKQIFQAYVEFQDSNLVDIVTDDYTNPKDIDRLIDSMAEKTVIWSEREYFKPTTFLFHGGMKLFRDDVWGRLRFVFQADHRNYQKNGFYETFPKNDKFAKKLNRRFMFLTKFSKFRKIFYKKVTDELVKPMHTIATHPDK